MDTTSHKIETIDTAITQRHQEIALYEINIANFEHIVREIEALPALEPDADVYQHREREALVTFGNSLRERIMGERIEMRKTGLILDALVAQRSSINPV